MTCINANRPDLNLVNVKLAEWLSIYLAPALKRYSKQITGHELVVRDLFNMQLTCAYELVSLGGSEFCEHFNGQLALVLSTTDWLIHCRRGRMAWLRLRPFDPVLLFSVVRSTCASRCRSRLGPGVASKGHRDSLG